MYTNMAHCAALYTNVMDKPDSDTPVLLLSYGQYPHLFFSRGITFAESLSLHTRRLKKLPPINRYYPLVPMLSSTSPSRSNSSTPAVNPLGVNYYDWGRRQPDRSPLSRLRYPHPDSSITKAALSEPLLGAVLVSPWMDFDILRDLYRANQSLVLTRAVVARRWSNDHMGDVKQDHYNQPIAAPSSLVDGCSGQGCAHYGWRGGGSD
jgi:hypothetical protein